MRAKCCQGNRKVQFQRLNPCFYTASPMPRCKHRKRNTFPKWQFLPIGKEYPAKVAAFRAILALPFAKRGECASCGNAQHLSCQPSRRVIRSRLSHGISPCPFLRADRPAIALHFSPLCYPLPHDKRILRASSRIVQLSTIDNYIMLLCSATQHQRVRQARPIAQGKAAAIVETGGGPHKAKHGRQRTSHRTA